MSDYAGRRSSTAGGCEHQAATAASPAPGKTTRVAQLNSVHPSAGAPAQRSESDAGPDRAAPGSAMPEGTRPTLQSLFGRPVQRRAEGDALPHSTTGTPTTAGTPMPTAVQAKMEDAYAADFSAVRVHQGEHVTAMGARAYAQGNDIHFAPGQYDPGSQGGQELLGHELAHVVQQREGRVQATTQAKGVAINDDTSLEQEADEQGRRAARGESARGGARLERGADAMGDGATAQQKGIGPASPPGAGVVQRDTWDPARHTAEQNLENQQNLRHEPARPVGAHPVHIGADQDPLHPGQTTGDERHIDDDMLRTLGAVLDSLPASHINGNPALVRIVLEHANGQVASFFGGDTLTIIVPFDAASWVYLNITKWPLGDLATTLGVTEHKGGALTRDVVGTGSNLNKVKMVPEKFVEWMLRHEVGHSVDEAIGWYANAHYRNAACGAWDIHTANLAGMVDAILTAVGVGGANRTHLDNAFNPHTGNGYDRMLQTAQNHNPADLAPGYRAAALAAFEANVPGGTRMVDHAESVIRRGLASPYENGGGVRLNNRTYHLDPQHGDWVSYQSNKYDRRDSNYQFQSPSEWFAETYSRYFKPPAAQWGQKVNDPAARAWFLANLDPVNNPGATLVNGLGNLVPMPAGIMGMPAAPVQNPAPPPGRAQNVRDTLASIRIKVATLPVSAVTRTAGAAIGTAQLGKMGLQAAYRLIRGRL